MFQSKTPDTVVLSDTVLKLDGLYDSYESVLAQVKDQLGNIDINDDHINRLCQRLKVDKLFISTVSKSAVEILTETLNDATVEDIEKDRRMSGLMKALARHVVFELSEYFAPLLDDKLGEYMTDEKLQEALTTSVKENPRMKRAYASLDTLESILQYISVGLKTED